MRPRKCSPSEPPNSVPSAQIIALDDAAVRLSKTSEGDDMCAAGTRALGRLRNSRGKLVDGLPVRTVIKEALPLNKRYQAKSDGLIASKEGPASRNNQLTALNKQLQETLEQQRTTANDLQRVLCSTDVATILLDVGLNVRFFTPATKLLFTVM
jgi:two-component system CheB/CheR fusion protein